MALTKADREKTLAWLRDCNEQDHLDPEEVLEVVLGYEAGIANLEGSVTLLTNALRRMYTEAIFNPDLLTRGVCVGEMVIAMHASGEESGSSIGKLIQISGESSSMSYTIEALDGETHKWENTSFRPLPK